MSSQTAAHQQTTDKNTIIFGTKVSLVQTSDIFKKHLLLTNYVPKCNEVFYEIKSDFPKELINLLKNYPTDVLPILEHSLGEYILEKLPNFVIKSIKIIPYYGYFFDGSFDSFLIDKLCFLDCVVLRVGFVFPRVVCGVYTCSLCYTDVMLSLEEYSQDANTDSTPRSERLNSQNERYSDYSINNDGTMPGIRNHIISTNARDNPNITNLYGYPNNANLNDYDLYSGQNNGNLLSGRIVSSNDLLQAATTPFTNISPSKPRIIQTNSTDYCPKCNQRFSLELNKLRSKFVDSYFLRVQEIHAKGIPRCFDVLCSDFVGSFSPGDYFTLFGVYRVVGEGLSFLCYLDLLSAKPHAIRSDKSDIESCDSAFGVYANGFNASSNTNRFSHNTIGHMDQNMLHSTNTLNNPTNTSQNPLNNANMFDNSMNTGHDLFNHTLSDGCASVKQSKVDESNLDSSLGPTSLPKQQRPFLEPLPLWGKSFLGDRFGAIFHSLTALHPEILLQILTRSIAPQITSNTLAKQSILCQLASGNTKKFGRSSIHTLLVGDPGIAKSQLLSFCHKISRGVYTSGSGASSAGITAACVRTPTGFVLEPGALVLCNNKICCIDEFDKVSFKVKSVLLEAMEQQTVSVAKGGIVATLPARCSVLASCNPICSGYRRDLSLVENIALPCALLSRFDLIVVLIDSRESVKDTRIARHITGMYTRNTEKGGCARQKNDMDHTKHLTNLQNISYRADSSPIINGIVRSNDLQNDHKKSYNPYNQIDPSQENAQECSKRIENRFDEEGIIKPIHSMNQEKYTEMNIPSNKEDFTKPIDILNIKESLDPSEYTLSIEDLKKYISIIKKSKPQITNEAKQQLKTKYKQMRQRNNKKTITATTRQLESMIRISEAIAKLTFTDKVTKNHVDMAYTLINEAMLQYAIDPKTGLIDMDIIHTGSSAGRRENMKHVMDYVENQIDKNGYCSLESVRERGGTEKDIEMLGRYEIVESNIVLRDQ